MTLRPLGDCLLIQPDPDPDYTETMGYTKVVVPDAYKAGPVDLAKWGRIMAFGTGCKYDKTCWATDPKRPVLHVGDRVIYGKYGWAKVELGEGKFLALVREQDLIAVVEA